MNTAGVLRVLTADKTVLMVCDVQECFRPSIYGFSEMCFSIRKMVRGANMMHMSVLATEQNYKFDQHTAKDIGFDELSSELNLGVFKKDTFSMITPEVRKVLQDGQYESIILVGAEAHACILQTTLDVLRLGLGVYVLADAVSSCNRAEIPIALDTLRQAGAVVMTTESILFRLTNDASDPKFAQLADLVKEHKDHSKESLKVLLGYYEEH